MATGTILMLSVVLGIFGVTWALLMHTIKKQAEADDDE